MFKFYSRVGSWLIQRPWGMRVVSHIQGRRLLYEITETVVFVVVAVLLIRGYIIEAYRIPSGSMKPTLLEGDRLFVNKFRYRFWDIKIGDVIVFKVPKDIPDYDKSKPVYIKRVVGLPGDVVEIRDANLYVNDKKIIGVPSIAQNRYVRRLKPQFIKSPIALAKRLSKRKDPIVAYFRNLMSPTTQRLLEDYPKGEKEEEILSYSVALDFTKLLNGKSIYDEEAFSGTRLSERSRALIAEATPESKTMDLNRSLLEDAFPNEISKLRKEWYLKEKVPEGRVYVFGDNSGDSLDSRYWGGVPIENIKGKAMFIWWPPDRIQFVE